MPLNSHRFSLLGKRDGGILGKGKGYEVEYGWWGVCRIHKGQRSFKTDIDIEIALLHSQVEASICTNPIRSVFWVSFLIIK